MLLKGTADKTLPLFLPCSTSATTANKTGTWRFFRPVYLEKTAPCATACPTGEDIARIEMLVARGDHHDAWQALVRENPFPAVCGRVCFHPCEQVCNRAQLDAPVAIRQLERSLGDRAISEGWAPPGGQQRPQTQTAAVIGAGPAGLAAAYFLARLGYGCELFEARPAPGGLLRWAIPAYRLPPDILAAEIDRIRGLGVRIHCNSAMRPEQLNELQSRFDALIVTCGYGRSLRLKISGAEHADDGLALLSRLRSGAPSQRTGSTAVIGGGNTAIDVARSLARMGAAPILVYRRRREDMPAFEPEIARALAEGVQLRELLAPMGIEADSGAEGPVYTLKLQKMAPSREKTAGRTRVIPLPGQTETLQVNQVVTAIGAEAADGWPGSGGTGADQLQMSHCRLMDAKQPIFIGGDLTTPFKSVADAIASGKQVAVALDTFWRQGPEKISAQLAACQVGPGPAVSMTAYREPPPQRTEPVNKSAVVGFDQINLDYFDTARRASAPYLSPAERCASFAECEAGLPPRAVGAEAERCFNCGSCNDCDNCRRYCPESAVQVDKAHRRIDLDYCKGCGVCVAECPRNAMAMEDEACKR